MQVLAKRRSLLSVRRGEGGDVSITTLMQLFFSGQYSRSEDHITITEDRIIHQCSRVLRMQPWDQIQIQDNNQRYTIVLDWFSKKTLTGKIRDTIRYPQEAKQTTLCVAIPNRRDKAELIAQKLTEIGVSHIVFRPASRSVLKSVPHKKQERIHHIALEASEQSFRTTLPTITFLEKWDEKYILWHDVSILFYQWGSTFDSWSTEWMNNRSWIIGPEWWFTPQELEYFSPITTVHTLWSSILRMETAAIIWSRLLQQ